ncbi:hypothetical protein IMZ68_03870 [Candidatus Bathyarchaeota archaeon]|nr:hypothetical protein [Candidatus Bathyarchaeota archaeon]
MSQDQEKMKSLMAFKKRLEDKLASLEDETIELQASLDTVNSILLDKGFRRGDLKELPTSPAMPKEVMLPKQEVEVPIESKPAVASAQSSKEPESVIPLKTMNEEPLALIYFDKQSMHVLPDESKNFSTNTPPFTNFLVERVFAKMQEKDAELVRTGHLTTDKMFSYNIVREEDLIREIIIKNVDEERLKELKSSIRWTLEKMYEKMKSPN